MVILTVHREESMKSETIYEGRILNLKVSTVELPNQKYSKREIVEKNKVVAIVPIKDDKIVLVKQYRIAVDKELLEIPAGIVEVGEEPREAALREMKEEIGYGSDDLEYLIDSLSSPGFTNEKTSYFLADNLYEEKLEADDDEFIEVVEMDIKEVIRMIEFGEINDSKTIIGVLLAARKLGY